MLYFTHEAFCRLANQIHGHIHVMDVRIVFNTVMLSLAGKLARSTGSATQTLQIRIIIRPLKPFLV